MVLGNMEHMTAAELYANCSLLTLWGQSENGNLEWVGRPGQHRAAKVLASQLLNQ